MYGQYRLSRRAVVNLSQAEYLMVQGYAEARGLTVGSLLLQALAQTTGIQFRARTPQNKQEVEKMKNANPQQNKNHQVEQVSNTILIADEIIPEVSGIIDADNLQMQKEMHLGRMM